MSAGVTVRSELAMGTIVSIQVLRAGAEPVIDRAFGWFEQIENCCSRFHPQSELMQLTQNVGVAVPVSSILFEAVRFACAVAEETQGAFDPAIGHHMRERGFDREHRTGSIVVTPAIEGPASYRDVHLDAENQAITLRRPLVLDLGAIAKGLAIDMAARELAPLTDFLIDAGGDLFLGGNNSKGEPWSVGIRHPRAIRTIINSLRVSNRAVCTSGDYERSTATSGEHHILDPRTGISPERAVSVTVVAPSAMLADALSTAAFVLGPVSGVQLMEDHGVDGLIVTPELTIHKTRGLQLAA